MTAPHAKDRGEVPLGPAPIDEPPAVRDESLREAPRDLDRTLRAGWLLVAALVAVIGIWGSVAQISGAVIAQGRLAVASGPQRIQHREGGIVSEITAQEGARVRAGQVVARLDATMARASDVAVQGQLAQAWARKLRLEAEVTGASTLAEPAGSASPELRAHLVVERALLRQQRTLREQAKSQLREQLHQARLEVDSLQEQWQAMDQQLQMKEREVAALRQARADGFATQLSLSVNEREQARLAAERGEVAAQIARSRSQLAALQSQTVQIDVEAQRQAMAELNDVMARLSRLTQERAASSDRLSRVALLSPVDGTVQQVAIRTPGGVLPAGETLMVIVPDRDELIVEARIDPGRIDQVRVGASARLRFTSFDANTSPEVGAIVEQVTPDAETDARDGSSHYRARLKLDRGALPPSLQQALTPGMPAEVLIQTGSRSALSHLLKPLGDHLQRAFADG